MRIRKTTSRPPVGKSSSSSSSNSEARSALAFDFLAMIPPELLQRLRTQGPQPKSYGPDDIVVPDPGCLLPKSAERCARFRLTSDHREITVRPSDVPILLGHRIMDWEPDGNGGWREGGGRLSPKVKMIDWPVIAIGKWGLEDEERARRAEAAWERNQAANRQRAKAEGRSAWWDGMREATPDDDGNGVVCVGDIVQSRGKRHLRRLWKVVYVQAVSGSETGKRCQLVGRRVSWKTGEVQPGRAHPIMVDVVRLVPRTSEQDKEMAQ